MSGASSIVRDKQLVSNSSSAARGVRNTGEAMTTLDTQKSSYSNAKDAVREKSVSKGRDNNNVRGSAKNATRRSKRKKESSSTEAEFQRVHMIILVSDLSGVKRNVKGKNMTRGNNSNVSSSVENGTMRSKKESTSTSTEATVSQRIHEKILVNVLSSVKRNVKGRNVVRDTNNNVKSNAENATSKSKKESTTSEVAERKSLNRVREITHTTSTHEGFSQSSEASKVISEFLRGLLRGLSYFAASRTTE